MVVRLELEVVDVVRIEVENEVELGRVGSEDELNAGSDENGRGDLVKLK